MNDNIFNDDPFGAQQSVTPSFHSLTAKGSAKLLIVLFVVDCSKTMSGNRIGAVNAALQELKYKLNEIKNDNYLDLKIAIMSFTSSARWELRLTPVEEVDLKEIKTRPGLTEYGVAFHELNKVLRKDGFMKHTGKIAPPAIMFLTDGEPTDDYQNDLDELLKNGWFANASRSAVLLGDAIYNDSAKKAVRKFVNDGDKDIVTAEDSTVIIQKIKLATMHTIAGDPITNHASATSIDQTSSASADAADKDDLSIGDADQKEDPFDFPAAEDPFGDDAAGNDPFDDPTSDPSFAGDDDIFSDMI